MIINRCDICGMTEGLKYLNDKEEKRIVTFSKKPIHIAQKNYRGEDYNIFVNVIVEKASDTQKMQDACSRMLNNKGMDVDIMDLLMQQVMNPNRGMKVQLDNPYPSICDECKTKILMAQLMQNNNY